jgi:hypothetical protein
MAISTIGASGLDSAVSQIGKNILHNGAMTVAQRGNSTAGVGGSSVYFAADRFKFTKGGSPTARWTMSRESSGGPPGFPYFTKALCTTAQASPAANQYQAVGQEIEAQNLQHLDYGAAGALTTTASGKLILHADGASSLSFPVTMCVALYQPDGDRSYVHEVAIAAADTWTDYSFSIDGDASGTINNDTGSGLQLRVALISDEGREATADAWAAGEDISTASFADAGESLADATNNYVGWTAVQLEVGSVATDFEHEPVGVTLAKCQRYFKRFSGAAALVLSGTCRSTTAALVNANIGPMRAAPTGSVSAAAWSNVVDDSDSGRDSNNTPSWTTNADGGVTTSVTVASGLTDGNGVVVEGKASQYAQFSAEL